MGATAAQRASLAQYSHYTQHRQGVGMVLRTTTAVLDFVYYQICFCSGTASFNLLP